MMPKVDKFYLVYHSYHGMVCIQTWWGDVTVNGKEMEGILLKQQISEAEFNLPLEELKAKYPFKEIPDLT